MRRSPHAMFMAVALFCAGGPAYAQESLALGTELERVASLSGEAGLEYVSRADVEIADAVKVISRLLDNARRLSDVDSIQCLTSRLTAVRALHVVVQNSAQITVTALTTGDTMRLEHEVRKVAVALDRSRSLLNEAQRCGAEQAVASGDTIVSMTGGDFLSPGSDDPGSLDDLYPLPEPPQITPFTPPSI